MKMKLWLLMLSAATLLSAQEAYEKQFIALIHEKVKDGNISSVSKVGCQKGDCRIDGLKVINIDEETGEKNKVSVETLKLHNVKDFIEFKDRSGALKKGESRTFALELKDIRENGHNLFFDQPKMAAEFGEKSEIYKYFKKYLDTASNASYSLTLKKVGEDTVIKDTGAISTGQFNFALHSRYTIKNGLKKLDEAAQTNPMGMMAFVVLNSIDLKLDNPKGFLKNLMYINYKSEMHEAASDQERMAINESFVLDGSKLHSQKTFTKMMLKNMKPKIKALAQQDPTFNAVLNKNAQLEKKMEAVLAGTSSHIYVKIENPKGLSIGDFFSLFMGYAMQQKLTVDPGVKITIQ